LVWKNEDNYKKVIALGLIAAMIAMVGHGMVDVPFFKNDLAVMWWLMIGLVVGLKGSISQDRTN
jgi:hypothetical protein